MSTVCFPIVIVLGLACGLTLREFKPLEEKEAVAARDIEEPAIRKDVRMNGQAIGPGWGLDGTLSLEAIEDLPVGGRRTGELVLWMAAASPAEWGARWDQLEAMDDRAGTWPEKQRLMMLWVAQDAGGAYRHVRGTASEAIFFRALAREDATEAMRLAADRNHFLQEATRHSLGAAMLKENFRGGLEFLAKDDAGWQAMVGALMMDREGGVSQALVESAEQLPSGWMEKILSDPGIGRWGHRFLGLVGQDASTLGVTEEVFADFARKVSSNGSGFQVLDERGRDRVMDLVNRPSLDLATRKALLRSSIRWWPQSEQDYLGGWLERLDDEALTDVADRSRESREDAWKPLEDPQDRIRKIASGESEDRFRVGTWTREETREVSATFASFRIAEKERTLRLLSREKLVDIVPADFAAELFQSGFELAEQGVKLPEVMKQLPEFVTYWAGREPTEAASWVVALPDGEVRQEAVGRVAREWREFSVAEVREWMAQLPEAERAEVAQVLAEN